jgi:hypothetical protein
MKTTTLLITTILSTSYVLGFSPPTQAADNIAAGTVKTATAPITKAEATDPRVAATGFVEHVNYARVALAMKNVELARQHITQARNMMVLIKGAAVEQRRITYVESGRISYAYDTQYKYHYFPIQTGLVQVKQMDNGPVWAKNDLAVTDADIVYLSLDLTGDTAETHLAAAENAITANHFKDADNHLAMLNDAVITVDSKMSVPGDKARDNIALARHFLAGKNYDGARYALKHAEQALNEMQRSEDYRPHRADIVAMRKNVSDLQSAITKKDPSMMQEADGKLSTWWNDLKKWSKKQ